jgi:hypothetical protein
MCGRRLPPKDGTSDQFGKIGQGGKHDGTALSPGQPSVPIVHRLVLGWLWVSLRKHRSIICRECRIWRLAMYCTTSIEQMLNIQTFESLVVVKGDVLSGKVRWLWSLHVLYQQCPSRNTWKNAHDNWQLNTKEEYRLCEDQACPLINQLSYGPSTEK